MGTLLPAESGVPHVVSLVVPLNAKAAARRAGISTFLLS